MFSLAGLGNLEEQKEAAEMEQGGQKKSMNFPGSPPK